MNLDIAVVVPTFNSSSAIASCLESIRNQTFRCSEVVVVDRFSSDGTSAIAKAQGATVIQVEANRSLARNIGLEHSSSNVILFVDADMILGPNVVEECMQCIAEHDAVVIPEVSLGTGFWARCKYLERNANRDDPLYEAARCFRKVAFLSIGMYDPRLEYGEDLDLQTRGITSGLIIGRISAEISHCEGHLSLSSIVRKKYLYGKAFGGYLRRNRGPGLKWMNPLRGIIVPSLKVFKSAPLYGIGIFVMRSVELTAAGLGHLVSNVERLTSHARNTALNS